MNSSRKRTPTSIRVNHPYPNFVGDLSFFNNLNLDKVTREGMLVACTRYAGKYDFISYILGNNLEAQEFEKPFGIHNSKSFPF